MIKIPVDSKNVPEVNVWITSDTHYSHKNICRGVTNWRTPAGEVPLSQTRDFSTIEKMNLWRFFLRQIFDDAHDR